MVKKVKLEDSLDEPPGTRGVGAGFTQSKALEDLEVFAAPKPLTCREKRNI